MSVMEHWRQWCIDFYAISDIKQNSSPTKNIYFLSCDCVRVSLLPLALGQVKGNGGGSGERLEEGGGGLGLIADEMGDGEDVAEGAENQGVLEDADEDAAQPVDAADAHQLQHLRQQRAHDAEEDGDAHPDEDESTDIADGGGAADMRG